MFAFGKTKIMAGDFFFTTILTAEASIILFPIISILLIFNFLNEKYARLIKITERKKIKFYSKNPALCVNSERRGEFMTFFFHILFNKISPATCIFKTSEFYHTVRLLIVFKVPIIRGVAMAVLLRE